MDTETKSAMEVYRHFYHVYVRRNWGGVTSSLIYLAWSHTFATCNMTLIETQVHIQNQQKIGFTFYLEWFLFFWAIIDQFKNVGQSVVGIGSYGNYLSPSDAIWNAVNVFYGQNKDANMSDIMSFTYK